MNPKANVSDDSKGEAVRSKTSTARATAAIAVPRSDTVCATTRQANSRFRRTSRYPGARAGSGAVTGRPCTGVTSGFDTFAPW